MSCQNKKVGIMGGTFDPIHYGHLILAQNALDTFSLDEILFVPSGTPWLKESTKVLSKNKRVSMTGMAIEDNPDLRYLPSRLTGREIPIPTKRWKSLKDCSRRQIFILSWELILFWKLNAGSTLTV